MLQLRKFIPALTLIGGLYFAQCSASDNETWQEPTQGVVTTVKEVSPGDYKIESEEPVSTVAESRVIVENMEGETTTYTLDQVKMIQQMVPDTAAVNRPFRSAGMGFFGYMMLGRMMTRPSAGAYTSPQAHQQATSRTGSALTRTSRTVSRPGARSTGGYGGNRSTRSVGG